MHVKAVSRIRKAGIILGLALVLHLLTIWLVPRAITTLFLRKVATQAGYNHIVLPPLPTDKSREVVKPSPDLLYAVCVFDLGGGPVRLSAKVPESYWSLALYGRNSDNFFRLNGRDAKSGTVEVILASEAAHPAIRSRHPDAIIVTPPDATGLVLTRSLVTGSGGLQKAAEARSQTQCEPLRE